MAVTLTKEFYINFGLFLFACLALALSIWAFATPCKKDGFGNSNANLICDFSLENPIQVNYESGGCSTSDVTGVIKYVKDNFNIDISGNCYKGSYYKLDLKDDEAEKLCNYIIN
jgi:hypothetical protein